MQIRKRTRFFAALTLAVVFGGVFAYVEYSLQHLQVDASGLGAFFNSIAATAQVATLKVPSCRSEIKQPSLGDQRREALMLYVVSIIDLYRTTFGRLPDRIEDLEKLPSFVNADALNSHQVKKSCSIHVGSAGPYVLTCGASLPSPITIDTFLAAKHVQGFQMLAGTEILYISSERGCS